MLGTLDGCWGNGLDIMLLEELQGAFPLLLMLGSEST